jgi:glycosyltransferase involved in cell wall biosynthesis
MAAPARRLYRPRRSEEGHDVTLFVSGDSETRARLVLMCQRSLRLDSTVLDPIAYHVLLTEQVMSRAAEFDVIHWHIDYLHFSLVRRLAPAHVTTLHGRLDLPHLPPIYDEFADIPIVSISDAQRAPLPQARWVGTVYHGLPPELYALGPGDGGYFAFLGRISPEKRVDRAVAIATRLGVPLLVAAKIDRADEEYFQRDIAHLFENPLVLHRRWRAEEARLAGARALLFRSITRARAGDDEVMARHAGRRVSLWLVPEVMVTV